MPFFFKLFHEGCNLGVHTHAHFILRKMAVQMHAQRITSNNEGLHTCRVSNLILVLKPDTLPGM